MNKFSPAGWSSAMLVLSRKKNEAIIIDGRIRITVVEVRGDKVRLGIEAPREVPVHRSEVLEAIRREEARMAQGTENAEETQSAS